jgi:hypothetical protein
VKGVVLHDRGFLRVSASHCGVCPRVGHFSGISSDPGRAYPTRGPQDSVRRHGGRHCGRDRAGRRAAQGVLFRKGADYYAHNAFFIAKVSLFIAVALFSIYPTREFLSWRKSLNEGRLPAVAADKLQSIRGIIHLELAGIALILLCAALMAKGIGSF